ncbi:hypothetical protein CMV_003788 [Castanea mollissima]|uniref:Uncharacterized protein n=1 Tax=Castanea mollissima TaxID=60419 RepID=A0A8J4W2S2_9ROSI|nr:hypothetical protein CMV_003788 [Castanea mollissima]
MCTPAQCLLNRYATYGPEYVYPQGGVYNPYAGQQYLQIYGVPGTVNTAVYPYGQMGQTIPGGHGYTAVPSYAMPGHQIVQFGGPSVNAITTSPMPTIQSPYPTGIAAPVAVRTKQLGEGLIKVSLDCSRTKSSGTAT